MGRSGSSSAREEERRKVLEIEEERLRLAQIRRGSGGIPGGAAGVGRSGSRASRTAGAAASGSARPVVVRTRPLSDDRDSQYSGHSSSSAKPVSGVGRFEQGGRLARVKRSTSNATHNGVGVAGPRVTGAAAPVPGRKKLPASLTSSLNSSESENVQHNNGGVSVGAAANGQRSVFLHSACVADIPPNTTERRQPPPPPLPPQRAQSAESRENMLGRPQHGQQSAGGPPPTSSNLQKSKKISRSISLLTPWKARQQQRGGGGAQGQQYGGEIHYDNNNIYGQGGGMATSGKPPRPPPASQRGRIIIPSSGGPPTTSSTAMQRDKKSASSTNLHQDEPPIIIGEERSSRTMQRTPAKVSRSVSMPKDTRLAGWFRKKRRV